MIRAARLVAVTTVAALLAVGLTACIQNNVAPAQSWLAGQDGVGEAFAVVDNTSMYGSSGVVRGELEDGIDGARLDALVERAAAYARDHSSVRIWLGVDDVDFAVEGDTATARELWSELRGLDGVVAALASASEGVRVHVLRPELAATVSALENLPASVEVEGFRTEQEERDDRRNDAYGPAERSLGSFQFVRAATCEPSAAQWTRFVETSAVDEIEAGGVDACGDYDLTYDADVDLSAVAVAWAAAQDASPDPVPTLVVKEDLTAYHEISVTPGDAALFPVVAAFEQPGAPVVQYWLAADGSLDIRGYDSAAGAVLAVLAASPLAAQLPSISLEGTIDGPVGGESVTARGSLDQLGSLVGEAEALFPLDPAFYQVAIEPESVTVTLYSPPGTDPDMASAAAALRSSPIWTTRDTYVSYLNGFVLIRAGAAELGSDTYSKPEPLEAFAAAWNAAATP